MHHNSHFLIASLLAHLTRLSLQQVTVPLRAFAEGDSTIDLYINGNQAPLDQTLDVFAMNTNYEIQDVNSGVQVFRLASELVDGDVVAVRATNTKPTEGVEVDSGHRTVTYPSYGGWILAMPNFIVSSAKHWRCTSEALQSWTAQDFNDTTWPSAVENPGGGSCCPWRDQNKAWAAVNAEWLWTADPVANRTVYCRYTVNTADFAEGMDGSGQNASLLAPAFSIQNIIPGSSWLTLEINVTTIGARIYCLPINLLYRMRAPTSREIERANYFTNVTEVTEESWVENTASDHGSNIPAASSAHIQFTLTADMEECRQRCRAAVNCGRISFWAEGTALIGQVNRTNCQLLEAVAGSVSMVTALDATSVIFHEVRVVREKLQTIDIQDGMSAGTEYEVYCTARGTDGSTTTQGEIAARMMRIITTGCFNCGIQSYPVVTIRGGFVTASRIFITIRLSLDGKAYCMARPHDPATGAVPTQPTEAEFRISSTIVPSEEELLEDVAVDIQDGSVYRLS